VVMRSNAVRLLERYRTLFYVSSLLMFAVKTVRGCILVRFGFFFKARHGWMDGCMNEGWFFLKY
jgi:hypothetical protein